MVKTIISGVVYDFYEPTAVGVGGAHEHDDTELTNLETRVATNEGILNGATENNTDGSLVKRKEITHFEDIVCRNVDAQDTVEVLADSGYFYWENPNRNQFIQIGSSLAAEDPSTALSGFTHYHQNTGVVSIQGNNTMAPLRVQANTAGTKNMFEIVDEANQIVFAVKQNGSFISQTITTLLNKISELESRIHVLENNAGL